MARRDEIKRLLNIHKRRLRLLTVRKASYGLEVPIATLLEIEDIEDEIKKLLDELESIADDSTNINLASEVGTESSMQPKRIRKRTSKKTSRQQIISSANQVTKIYHNLPQPDYENFVGRQEELKEIYNLLRPKTRHFVITIDGIGGIGKTALALAVADSYLRSYDRTPIDERLGAIVWVSAKQTMLTGEGVKIRSQALTTIDEVFAAIAITLERKDITRARPHEQPELVRHALMQQRTLLIIDNLETIDDERVVSFIREVPEPTKVIVTTRHRIDVARAIRLTGMKRVDALALIADESKKKGVILNESAANQLYDRTGGVPLAIVWSIAQIGFGYEYDAVLNRLGQDTKDIAEFCFEGSVEQIRGKYAYDLLRAITVFSKDASREALGFVANLPELDRDDGLVALEKLSLVNRWSGRFQILPLTLAFSKAELAKDKELEIKFRERWIAYLLNFLIVQGQRYENLENIRIEMENILAAMDSCLENGNQEIFLDFLRKMNFYLLATGNWSTWARYLEVGSQIAHNMGDEFAQADVLSWYASMRYYQDDLNESQSLIEKAIDIYQKHKNINELALCIRRLASIQIKRKEFEIARVNLDSALAMAQETNNKRYVSRILRQLAILDINDGDFESAEQRLHQARILREQDTELSSGLAYIYKLLGQLSFIKQHYDSARRNFQRSLEIAEKISSQHDISEAKQRLAELFLIIGQIVTADKLVREAIEGFSKLGMRSELRSARELLEEIEFRKT